jgi:hypothetical protein
MKHGGKGKIIVLINNRNFFMDTMSLQKPGKTSKGFVSTNASAQNNDISFCSHKKRIMRSL